jgi:hypothetical protein
MADFLRSLAPHLRISSLMFALALGSAPGCQQAQRAPGTEAVVPTYNAGTGRLERISYDRNADGKPDAWLFMNGTKATRAELDENNDGAVDRWEHYRTDAPTSTAGPAPRGELIKAEQSTRFDGKVSRWETYELGRLVKVEEDTTGDGRPDKWETWTEGSLAEVALDTKGLGKADRRIVYPADGSTPQLLVDDKGDGAFHPIAAQP